MIHDQQNNMTPELIETYLHEEEGFNPFFIRDNWQVAQLNYTPSQDIYGIDKVERHLQTDEVFILISGSAILIAAEPGDDFFSFQCTCMKIGITYNIPVNVWHNIAMTKDAVLIIVEKSNTHLSDVVYKPLSETEKEDLSYKIQNTLNHSTNK
jgi:mannose-6-phosphate isomerase-like protein (cupin superfamily)